MSADERSWRDGTYSLMKSERQEGASLNQSMFHYNNNNANNNDDDDNINSSIALCPV